MSPSLFADGIDLVENDAMELTFQSFLILVSLSINEQLSDVLLAPSHHLTDDFGSVHYLRLNLEDLADLSGDECLACAWRPVEKHALDVLESEMSHDPRINHSGGKDPSVDELQLLVVSSNPKVFNL